MARSAVADTAEVHAELLMQHAACHWRKLVHWGLDAAIC